MYLVLKVVTPIQYGNCTTIDTGFTIASALVIKWNTIMWV